MRLRAMAGFNADWTTDYDGLDNGYHAELDGERISGPGIFVKKRQRRWWYSALQHSGDGQAVSFTVDTPGQHTFSIVRREQLSRLDKIVIHDGTYGSDSASTLSGSGPSETAVTGSLPDAGADGADARAPLDAGDNALLRVEAEHMALHAYRVEDGTGFASNDQMVTLRDGPAGETGTATYIFGGAPGHYDVVLAYFDECDGVASLQLHIDGLLSASFDLDQGVSDACASAQSLVRETVAGAQALAPGSAILITGVEDPDEPARVDYIELIAVSAPPDADTPDTARPDNHRDDATGDDVAQDDAAADDATVDDATVDDATVDEATHDDDTVDSGTTSVDPIDAGVNADGATTAGGASSLHLDTPEGGCAAKRAPTQATLLLCPTLFGSALWQARRRRL